MRIYLTSFGASVAIHALIVCVLASLPTHVVDPLRYMHLHESVQRVEPYRAVVQFALADSWREEPGDDAFEDEMPDFADQTALDALPQPVLPNLVYHGASSLEPGDEKAPDVADSPRVEAELEMAPRVDAQPDAAPRVDAQPDATPRVDAQPDAASDVVLAQGPRVESGPVAASRTRSADQSVPGVKVAVSAGGTDSVPSPVDQEALWQAYAKQISAIFAKKRTYPPMARRLNQSGSVLVEMELAQTGQLLQAQIVRSSGSKILDKAALDLIEKVDLPPLPSGIRGDKHRVRVPIEYRLK